MDRGSNPEYLRDYFDFDLEIRQGGPQGYSVVVKSPAGEAEEAMRFPFDERQLRDKLKDLEIALLRSGGTRRQLTSEERTVQDFGQELFNAVFGGKVGARYYTSLEQAGQQDKGLRLKLHVQPPELCTLPWEFLYDPDRDYLCFSRDTPIIRYTNILQPIRRLAVEPPLRILGVVASPRGLAPLNVEHEIELMDEAMEDLQADGVIELTWLEGQSWQDLLRAMRRGGPWHIFHFVGHGDFDQTNEEGLIALTNKETGREDLLRSKDLARLLSGHRTLRLVFLNSCEGARGSEGDPFSGTAATLVRHGTPAVVAMQYAITDKATIEFSRAFYESLADGFPVDAAMTEARVAVSIDSMLEWGMPVLYMRSRDGRLFDVSASASRTKIVGETKDAIPVRPEQATKMVQLDESAKVQPIESAEPRPYRGPQVFNEKDTELFFGRQRVVRKLVGELRCEPNFLTVLGPSGGAQDRGRGARKSIANTTRSRCLRAASKEEDILRASESWVHLPSDGVIFRDEWRSLGP
jgi:hypothetical protein